jgi:hypothetical protein
MKRRLKNGRFHSFESLSRHAILLKQKTAGKHLKNPFDIKGFRVHAYDFSHKGFAELKRKLPAIITHII